MIKHFQIFTFLHLFAYSLFALPANDIDKDPWLRSWLFVGPFEDYESAIKLSDSLSNSSFQEIEDFVKADPNLISHNITSNSSTGRHAVYQYFEDSNENFVIGFCKIKSSKSIKAYYNQIVHPWDFITFYLNDALIIDRNGESLNWKDVDLSPGSNAARMIFQVKPFSLSYVNNQKNDFSVGIFMEGF